MLAVPMLLVGRRAEAVAPPQPQLPAGAGGQQRPAGPGIDEGKK
jgi:hypothetical protein